MRQARPAGRHRSKLLAWGGFILFAFVVAAASSLVHSHRVNASFQATAVRQRPASGHPASVPLVLANDRTGALAERTVPFALPPDPSTRARLVLRKLLAEYTAPGSLHPLPRPAVEHGGVDEVYLLPAPDGRGQLAVVDLTRNFVRHHPSGIEPETLTLLSVIATLHANLPQVMEVHFLVDGAPAANLAGHADLTRTYLAASAEGEPRAASIGSAAPRVGAR